MTAYSENHMKHAKFCEHDSEFFNVIAHDTNVMNCVLNTVMQSWL